MVLKSVISLFILFQFIACTSLQESDCKPVFFNFKNDWEEMQFFGEVKSCTVWKTIVQSDGNPGDSILQQEILFTEFGNIQSIKSYDELGILKTEFKAKYDSSGDIQSTVTEDKMSNYEIISIYEYENDNGIIRTNFTFPGSGYINTISFLDSSRQVIKIIEIKNDDSSTTYVHHIFDEHDRLIAEHHFQENSERNGSKFEYEYNENGHLVEFRSISNDMILTTRSRWKGNRLIERRHFSTIFGEMNLNEVYWFDKCGNVESKRIYSDPNDNREFKYDYELDRMNNWVKKETYMKESSSNNPNPLFFEVRTIEYWK